MNKDFRPSSIQIDYLNEDILPFLGEMGMDLEKFGYEIKSIDWYNWDNDGRWFVNLSKVDMMNGKYLGYIEVDVKAYDWNGEKNPMEVRSVELAGHGYPCSSIQILKGFTEEGEYSIAD